MWRDPDDTDQQPHRRSVRLLGYSYAEPGEYFATLCTERMKSLFGRVADGQMVLSAAGLIAQQCWLEIPKHLPHVELDVFVVMPNHLHGILVIKDVGARHGVPVRERFGAPVAGSLATIIRLFKQAVTRRVKGRRGRPLRIWQRNYYEHIVRPGELDEIREYIRLNPVRWTCDRYNPDRSVLVMDVDGRLRPR